MATDNPTNDPKTATADEAAIQDLPESKDSTALTPDEETNVRGGGAIVNPTPTGGAADRECSAPSVSEIVVTKVSAV